MKKTLSLLIAFAMLFAVGCSDSKDEQLPLDDGTQNPDDDDDDDDDDDKPLTFVLDIQTTSRTITMKVTPSDDTKYFFASYMSYELFEQMGYDQYPQALKDFWASYLEDYANSEKGLEAYIFKGEYTNTFTGANALPESKYVACIFGIEPDMTFTTDIMTQNFETKEREGQWVDGVTFDVIATATRSYGFDLNYKVSGPDVTWLSFLQLKENFTTDYNENVLTFVTSERNRFDTMLLQSGKTWTEYLRSSKDFDEVWNQFGPDTEYVVVAVGISEDGALITDPSEPFFFRTKADGAGVDIIQETEHFRFSVTNLTSSQCNWSVEPLYEVGDYDYMFAEIMPDSYLSEVYNIEDLSEFGALVSEIWDKTICRNFWYSPDRDKYLAGYGEMYQHTFLTDLDGNKFTCSFRDMTAEGFDMTKPVIIAAFTAKPDVDFDWTTFSWDDVIPHSTIGETEHIEFSVPAEEEEQPATLQLPAGIDEADMFHYYRMASR